MPTFNKTEFWQELEATDEAFIKRKLALGGYSPQRRKIVNEWLQRKEEARRIEQEALELNVARQSNLWNRFNAIATCVTAIVAIAALFWPK